MKNLEKAKKYNKIKIRLKLVDILFSLAYLVIFQLFASSALSNFSKGFSDNRFLFLSIYLAIFAIIYYLVNFPLHFYSSFILEHKFTLSNQNFHNWLKDDIKSALLSGGLFFIFLHVLYILILNFTFTWWIWIAIFWFTVTIILAKVTPNLIIPLFFKCSPVRRDLKERIIALSKKCKIRLVDVLEIDFSKKTNKLNAAVVGLGKTRRVIVADNLLKEFTDEEVEGVLAHEFGHHKLRHMGKNIIFGIVSIFLSCYLLYFFSSKVASLLNTSSVSDISMLPSLLLILFLTGLVMLPIENAFSRRMETEADIFALKTIRDKQIFISLMRKLSEKNLADPKPSKLTKILFYSHPPISERIALAERF